MGHRHSTKSHSVLSTGVSEIHPAASTDTQLELPLLLESRKLCCFPCLHVRPVSYFVSLAIFIEERIFPVNEPSGTYKGKSHFQILSLVIEPLAAGAAEWIPVYKPCTTLQPHRQVQAGTLGFALVYFFDT
jgi:hypothetical protein